MPGAQSISEQIYNHALRLIHPFTSELGHTWAATRTGPLTHQAWPLASTQFRAWLGHSFFAEHDIFPSDHALRHAVRIIQARAHFGPQPREEVFTRIGWRGNPFHPEALAIHLANSAHEIIEITAQGWRVANAEPWRFRPAANALPLPTPRLLDSSTPGLLDSLTPGLPDSSTPGLLDSLTPGLLDSSTPRLLDSLNPGLLDSSTPGLLNSSTPGLLDSLVPRTPRLPASLSNRLTTWLFAALRPAGPYPILILSGPSASGKSTIARILRNLIDPIATPLLTFPKTERELYLTALHNRVLAFDHVPALARPQSVALARLAAGTAFFEFGRRPFDTPLPFAVERPVILTIPSTETATAFWNRNHTISSLAITVQLDAIEPSGMQPAHEITRQFENAAPAILARLCDAAAAALANVAHTSVTAVSRFVDVQQWTASAAPSLGLTLEDVNAALTATPLIRALTELLNEYGEWTGAPTDLLTTLQSRSAPDLPTNTKSLTLHLNSTPLAVFGIHYSTDRKTNGRRIKLHRTDFIENLSCFAQTSVMN